MAKENRLTGPSSFAKSNYVLARAGALLDRWPGIGLVLWVAAVLRVVSVFLLRSYLHPVSWEFGEIATRIHAGLGYTLTLPNGGRAPSAYMPPAYPYLLVLVLKCGGGPLAWMVLELIQAGLGVVLVWVIYRTALLVAERRVAIAVAIMVAVFPTQIYICNEFHSVNFYILLGAGAVFYLTRYMNHPYSIRDLIYSSLCMGVLVLFRSEAVALLALYAAVLIWRLGWSQWKRAAVFVCLALACFAPWTVRNLLVFGKFLLVSDVKGMNLWIGHNPLANGGQHYVEEGAGWSHIIPSAMEHELAAVRQDRDFEPNGDAIYERYALHFIRTHPRAEFRLISKKLFFFVFFDPTHEKGRNPMYWVPSLLLSVFAVYGAWLRGRKLLREDIFLLVSILFAVAITAAVFALPRYKIVIDPFLMIFAANCVSRWGMTHNQYIPAA